MRSEFLTTTLTTKGMNISGQYELWPTDYCTGLLSVDVGGLDSVELENRQG